MHPLTRRAGPVAAALAAALLSVTCSSNSPTSPAGPSVGTVTAFLGNNQPGLVGFGVNVRPAVRVVDTLGNPKVGATVTFAVAGGGGGVTGGTAVTNANGVAQVGRWTLGGAAGVNSLTATVAGGTFTGNPVTFRDTALAAGYAIQVQYFGPAPSATIQAAMNAAVTKWQSIIYRALSSITLNKAANACGAGEPAVSATSTGLIIQAEFDSIDGPGKILGQAGPCMIRTPSGLTVLGVMEFDTADVAQLITQGLLNTVMLHEMGHVIGFGTLWDFLPHACLQDTSSSSPKTVNDTYFSCAKGRAAFDSIGGLSYTGASLSPPGLEPPAHLEAVHVRHHHVEQHDVAFGALAYRERLLAAQRRDDVEILRRQPRFHQLDVRRHVVDHKNTGSHRRAPSGRAEKMADRLDELADRDRLRQVGLAAALADALLVALHRKRRHRHDRNGLEVGIVLEPLGDFEPRHLGQLDVHQDQIRVVLACEIERLDAVARPDGPVTMGFQQVVEELHIELVVFHDEDGLGHPLSPYGRRPPYPLARVPAKSIPVRRSGHAPTS